MKPNRDLEYHFRGIVWFWKCISTPMLQNSVEIGFYRAYLGIVKSASKSLCDWVFCVLFGVAKKVQWSEKYLSLLLSLGHRGFCRVSRTKWPEIIIKKLQKLF